MKKHKRRRAFLELKYIGPGGYPARPKFKPPMPADLTPAQIKYRDYLASDHWILFRLEIVAKRGAYCERCHSDKRIQVHHLTYERLGHELPSDVAVLCFQCHERAHGINQITTTNKRWP